MLTKKYNENSINLVKKLIAQENKEFEVLVDDLKIISRTTDLDKLDMISDFLSTDSEVVTVKIFRGSSQYSDVVFLKLQNDLRGLEKNDVPDLEELREKIRKEILAEQSKISNEKALKLRIEELEEELEKAQSLKSFVNPVIQGLGSILAKNASLVKQYPILGALGDTDEEKNEVVKVPPETKKMFEDYVKKCEENPSLMALIHAHNVLPEEKLKRIIEIITNYET